MDARRHARGFNLVEVVIVLAILAVLLGLALSGYGAFVANQKVRAAAEVFKTTVLMARAEAVKRNGRVQVIRTNSAPIPANVDSATAAADGVHLIVRAGVAAPFVHIEGRSGSEGTGAAEGATPSVILSGPASLTFDSFGMVIAPALPAGETIYDFDFSNPAAGSCATSDGTGGPIRCQRVRVSRGGQARLCDPATLAGDTRFCGI